MNKVDPRLAGLSPAKRALLLRMLETQNAGAAPTGIPRLPREAADSPNAFRLSFAQQRLWFLDQVLPGTSLYNIPFVIRLSGPLDVDALERTLGEIVRRHEVLRTTFEVRDGAPVQVVHPYTPFRLGREDLSTLPPGKRSEALASRKHEEAERPFDLGKGPLVRGTLLRQEEHEHVLLLTKHHIVGDGWSVAVLIKEIVALYEAFSRGKPSPLPELPIQYADFAQWQREMMDGEVLKKQLAYWKDKLADLPDLELTPDRARPERRTGRGGHEVVTIPVALADKLKELSRREGTTLYVTLLAAFKVLLHHYTRAEDVVVGSAIANRNRLEVEELVGFFVNTLVLRTDLSGSPTFAEVVARVREVVLGADAHQDLPFEKLVEELHPQRSTLLTPLFQVMFLLQNVPFPELKIEGLVVEPGVAPTETSKFDLFLSVDDTPRGLVGTWEYDADIFDQSTIARIAAHYTRLLEDIVADPAQPIADLTLTTEDERRRIVFDWNACDAEYPRDASVHSLVERTAEQRPDAIAVAFGDDAVTYRELNQRGNQLARHLLALGVAPGTLVALRMERGVSLIVGMLAILKAGAAYLPLDPSYPKERIAVMLEDSAASVVITDGDLAEAPGAARTVRLDVERDAIAAHSNENLAPAGADAGEAIAYAMYTSGSTGQPKGILIPHRAILRLVVSTNYVQVGPNDRVAQASNASFDAATFEIWGALVNGATLIGVKRDVSLSPRALSKFLRDERISICFLTTPLFVQIVQEDPAAFASLRCLLFGGEFIAPHLVAKCLQAGPPARLLHVYGPTESTTFATSHTVEEVGARARTVPIGRPLANTQTYILNTRMKPVPVGALGELYIGGDGLAKGYLNRPELTQEKFVVNPFAGPHGTRLYRTGDVARYRDDGAIEFFGRVDRQVKYRGFRIELGEIETLLLRHMMVQDGAVLLREDTPGDKRLVGYVVVKPFDKQAEAARTDHVSLWHTLYEDLYRAPSPESDPTFNTVGWMSSYTGKPIPADEMTEWLEDTVRGVLSSSPKEVLEIGCGTGLVLFKVAPTCTRYVATDFSQATLEYVRRTWDATRGGDNRVRLLHRTADDFSGFEPESFDVVVLNSIVQYFPGAEYLSRVLEGAVRVLRPGGTLFIGDVRSLPLLEAYHAAVELERAEATLPSDHLRRRVRLGISQEKELALDPAFFHAMAARLPRIARVDIAPKRGAAVNELTQFRYQVSLRIGPLAPPASEASWVDWERERLTLEELRRRLAEERPAMLALSNVPNARVLEATKAVELLASADPPKNAGAVRTLAREAAKVGVRPSDLVALAESLGYRVELGWGRQRPHGALDAILLRGGIDVERTELPRLPADAAMSARTSFRELANNPLLADASSQVIPAVREHLAEKLPEYMVPTSFVVLDAMPLNPNGKIDRKALPAPDRVRSDLDAAYAGPRDDVEVALTRIWEDCLNIRPIGINDNFFELGGHSLLAVRLVADIHKAFGRDVPVSTLFQAATIANLATLVRGGDTSDWSPIVPIRPVGSKCPVFFIHPAGGTVFCYFDLAKLLDPERPFYALEARGLREGQEPVTSIAEMTDLYADAIRRVQPHGPYLLGGWSFGGPMALEVAARLTKNGGDVRYVALLDVAAPTKIKEALGTLDDAKAITNLARDAFIPLALSEDELRRLPAEDQLRFFVDAAQAAGKMPPGAGIVQLRRFLHCSKLNVNMMRLHVPQSYSGRVGLIRAADVVDPAFFGDPDPTMGWSKFVRDPLDIRHVPGDHASMLQEPHVPVLAQALRELLDAAGADNAEATVR